MNRKEKVSTKSAGFVDADIATDKHDEIMIWLDQNIENVLFKLNPEISVDGVEKQWEFVIKKGERQYTSIVGYIDMLVTVRSGDYEHYLAFEVKSKINSLGEVIRQINQYKAFCPPTVKFFVVCPDDKFAKIFVQQGIGFVKAELEE